MLLTTDSIPRHLSFQYWKDYVCDIFVQLEVRSHRQEEFFGSIQNVAFGSTQFSEVCAHQQVVNRTAKTISKSSDDYFLLSIQLEGQGRIQQDGKMAVLGASDMCLYDSTRPYCLEFDDAFRQLVLRIPRHQARGLVQRSTDITAQRIVAGSGIGKILYDHYTNMYNEYNTLNRSMSGDLDAIGVNLLQLYFNQNHEVQHDQDIMTLRIKDWIEKHLFTREFTIADMAKELRCSRRLIYNVFEKSDHTPYSYIQMLRLNRAKEMLDNPLNDHLSIKEIGQICGFQNSGHFATLFKKHFACTPGSVRKL